MKYIIDTIVISIILQNYIIPNSVVDSLHNNRHSNQQNRSGELILYLIIIIIILWFRDSPDGGTTRGKSIHTHTKLALKLNIFYFYYQFLNLKWTLLRYEDNYCNCKASKLYACALFTLTKQFCSSSKSSYVPTWLCYWMHGNPLATIWQCALENLTEEHVDLLVFNVAQHRMLAFPFIWPMWPGVW